MTIQHLLEAPALVWRRLPPVLILVSVLPACSFGPAVRQVELPLPPPRVERIETHDFTLGKDDNLVGQLASVPIREGDTLSDIARHYGLGLEQLSAANPELEPWTPQADYKAILPLQFILPDAPRKGVVVNLASMRMFHFSGSKSVPRLTTYPVGIGKEGRSTPLGQMAVERKTAHPTWYVPDSIRRDHALKGDPLPASVSPGPDNPLGDYAMYLTRPSYLIHGTNKPYSIGFRASNGCIRLYPEDIERLFKSLPEKTPVKIVNQPFLVGFHRDEIYLEVHEPHEEMDIGQLKKATLVKLKQMEKKLGKKLDWAKVEQTLTQARGIPVPILENTDSFDQLVAKAVALSHPAKLYAQPEPPTLKGSSWYIQAGETVDEISAKRLAAMLNHQGPRIPAQTVLQNGRYQIYAGPYKDAKATKIAAKRMKIDLEIDGEIIAPKERANLRASR